MKYFFDTEFIEDGKTIDLISIGIVAEDGREFYAESVECDHSRASDWVKANVLPHLTGAMANRHNIAAQIIDFVGDKPEFWGYYADYDWVALCQLYGKMIDLPKGWPMYCRDLKQLLDDLGNPKMPKPITEHNALSDAQWNWWVYRKLLGIGPEAPNAQAEVAALKEPMSCGHPKACLVHVIGEDVHYPSDPPNTVRKKNSSHCTACEQLRLERAATLREIAEELHKRGHDRARLIVEEKLSAYDSSMACGHPRDRSALDAHDAEVRDRALEEAAAHCESRVGLPRTGAYDALTAVAREIRAKKRGSK